MYYHLQGPFPAQTQHCTFVVTALVDCCRNRANNRSSFWGDASADLDAHNLVQHSCRIVSNIGRRQLKFIHEITFNWHISRLKVILLIKVTSGWTLIMRISCYARCNPWLYTSRCRLSPKVEYIHMPELVDLSLWTKAMYPILWTKMTDKLILCDMRLRYLGHGSPVLYILSPQPEQNLNPQWVHTQSIQPPFAKKNLVSHSGQSMLCFCMNWSLFLSGKIRKILHSDIWEQNHMPRPVGLSLGTKAIGPNRKEG